MTEFSLSPAQEDDVRRADATGGRIAAFVRIRQLTGASLTEAISIAQALLPASSTPKRALDVDLEVLVVGGLVPSVIQHLPYSPERYLNIPCGTPIIANLASTLSDDDVLAWIRVLHVDPWDFNTHCVDLSRLDLDDEHHPWVVDEYPPLEALRAFRDAGFTLHVYPRAPSQSSP
ncbi:hypothetical protein AKJ09_10813 [Labilithrix luteola]|uniref:Uncharacterized protein n=1 Tax=Labilithrix luteola TaxID=1391654 RepID=A0A0K1QFE1_9BACT|nr:hypothetical protein [Labilithrix luteola]AKV04150.1 hypothetical protein AKJ09_10813 [Labilithrix luteola]